MNDDTAMFLWRRLCAGLAAKPSDETRDAYIERWRRLDGAIMRLAVDRIIETEDRGFPRLARIIDTYRIVEAEQNRLSRKRTAPAQLPLSAAEWRECASDLAHEAMRRRAKYADEHDPMLLWIVRLAELYAENAKRVEEGLPVQPIPRLSALLSVARIGTCAH